MTDAAFRIRPARPGDADAVARLCAALSAEKGLPAPAFTAAHFRRDGVGPEAAFSGLVAERDGAPLGYALHARDYDTDRLERCVCLADLFVEKTARRLGIGRALVAGVAAAGRDYGATCLSWGVRADNAGARAFYRAIGGAEHPEMIWCLAGPDHLETLIRRALPPGVALREGRVADVPVLARFLEALFHDMDRAPPPEIERRLARDGFGSPRFFSSLLAERDGGPVGYAFFWGGYDTQTASRTTILSDLYVAPEARRAGIGAALMSEVARRGRAAGAPQLRWPVFADNRRAREYHARIAVEEPNVIYCLADGAAFERLIAAAPPVEP
ncbi:MAG: GNAT family N-acetyltransferase [Pseudomonadota bacterium]